MLFNINKNVKVKLTEHGRNILRKNWDEMFPEHLKHLFHERTISYIPPETDAEGWTKFQLWHLMEEFSGHIYLGCEMPFEGEIEIIE